MTARTARKFFFYMAILLLLGAAATPFIHEWIFPSAVQTATQGDTGFWSELARLPLVYR